MSPADRALPHPALRADLSRKRERLRAPDGAAHHAPVTRQITLPTSSAISSDFPSGPIVTPTGRP